VIDELEEIAGTFHKKVDAAIVIRRAHDPPDPHRKLAFPKTRRGPELKTQLAILQEDECGEPRLELIGDLGQGLKPGTDPAAMAKWIASERELVSPEAICTHFDISEETLRRRREELAGRGIVYDRRPGAGNRHAYGTEAQWIAARGGVQESLG
jgi:hypothetical protein